MHFSVSLLAASGQGLRLAAFHPSVGSGCSCHQLHPTFVEKKVDHLCWHVAADALCSQDRWTCSDCCFEASRLGLSFAACEPLQNHFGPCSSSILRSRSPNQKHCNGTICFCCCDMHLASIGDANRLGANSTLTTFPQRLPAIGSTLPQRSPSLAGRPVRSLQGSQGWLAPRAPQWEFVSL